ncbi:MAG: proline--tRNA ligase, partial [Notoacmeibacter sp.]|nr:proline--tRNA ligase [Notoacmeibacter sp.]
PDAVAPFEMSIINMKPGNEACDAASERLYGTLAAAGCDVLYDDTDKSAGQKFATHDLIGIPYQIIAGPRGVAAGEVEVKNRRSGERETMTIDAAINRFGGRA